MTKDTEKKTEEYERLINAKWIELLKTQNDIREFTSSDHRARDTKEYQKDINKLAAEINDFVILLIDTKDNMPDLTCSPFFAPHGG